MTIKDLLKISDIVQVLMCLGVLAAMLRRRVMRDFPALAALVSLFFIAGGTTIALLFYRVKLHIPPITAYQSYFYVMWFTSLAEFVLLALIIYGLFSNAMKPFPGLHRIGKIVFRWVGVVSFAVAVALAAGPQLLVKGMALTQVITELASRLQQGISVLILCLLIFVCFAIRPLGLTFRSHIFGVVLGLAVMSTVDLVQAAWFATIGAHSLYSAIYLFSSVGVCTGLGVWTVYFALPEPKRRMILLPTTSPFFLWNRISEVLGDAPGQVAVAGFTPNMLAPAEIQMLTAATSREAAAARARDEIGYDGSASVDASPEPRAHRPAFALSQ